MRDIICGIAISFILAIAILLQLEVKDFKDKCRAAGGIPDTYQMVCRTKASAIDLGVL